MGLPILEKVGLDGNPPVRERVRASMHLHAVLGSLPHLVRLDPEGARLARGIGDVALEFRVFAGPRVVLEFRGGSVQVRQEGGSDVGIFFPSCQALNRMFDGEKVTPIPFKFRGIGSLRALQRFPAMTDRLTHLLKPTREALEDPSFRARHVEISLLVGLAAVSSLLENDPRVKQRVGPALHHGSIQYEVPGVFAVHVLLEPRGIRVGAGPLGDPATTITIRDVDLALGLLQGTVDTFAANGSGDIRASGDLHLADEFNQVFERVGFYLK
ncbi:MAG TPA: SCP2 sterol-binding domain-containing protein [Myxococcota bacterium]|nr:SCP2 sterol-binding domain-containing protein [Myxococcota bacterium]HQK49600.1 SCP2 sterol-binding domain-containing protein [Myxococcota bacterium]